MKRSRCLKSRINKGLIKKYRVDEASRCIDNREHNKYSIMGVKKTLEIARGRCKAENEFINYALNNNYFCITKGFPDAILLDKNTLYFVEVKGEKDYLTQAQVLFLTFLTLLGFECRISSGNELGRKLDKDELADGVELLKRVIPNNSFCFQENLIPIILGQKDSPKVEHKKSAK